MKPDTTNKEPSIADQTGEYVQDAKAKATGLVEDTGSSIGAAMETANENAVDLKLRMEAGYRDTVSPKIDAAQTKLATASRYLQEKDFPSYMADLEQFAREHPRITTVVSVIVGWKLGRALTFGK